MAGPRIFDPKHTAQKFAKYLELINTKRVVAFIPATRAFVARNATASHRLPSLDSYEWSEMDATSFSFGEALGDWFAFKADLVAPPSFDPSAHFLHFDFVIGRNYLVRSWDDDTPAGPEGRFWLNGKVIAAIDAFHSGCTITELGSVELRIFTGRCRSCHSLARFGVSAKHTATESLYQRLRFLISVIKELDKDNPDRAKLIRVVDAAVRRLDIRDLNFPVVLPEIRRQDEHSTAFYQSVPTALGLLRDGLAQMPRPSDSDPAISVIGYSHIDTCWLWPFGLTRFKSANTAAGMLHLIESPPSEFGDSAVPWKFLATAAQHYKWLKADSPEIYAKVIAAIGQKRWDVNGGMWVEPDTTLPNGESLVRQLVLGVRYFESELGAKQTVLVLPDCFGFSANLPQILRRAGIDSFLTAKISWCEYTHFPHSTFVWRGIDGSDVVTHFITTPSSWSYQTATYTGVSTACELIGTLKAYNQKDVLPTSALHTSGNGDGGGGITEEMVWNLNLFAQLPKLQGVPRVIFPTIEEVFAEIRAKRDELEIWDDELYLEYHRGTLTTQEEVKRQNRLLEAHLHNVEWLMVVANTLCRIRIDQLNRDVQEIWEDTLLFHFHDAIPGSSVNEANQDIMRRGRPHLHRLRELEVKLGSALGEQIDSSCSIIFNTLAHPRFACGQKIPSGGWNAKDTGTILLLDEQPTTTYERIARGESHEVHTLTHPFIETTLAPIDSNGIVIDGETRTVTTPFFVVTFSANGSLESIWDPKTDRQYLSGPGNLFELYEDRPINWPAWDIQLYHKEMQIESPVFDSMTFETNRVVVNYKIARVGDGPAETSTISQVLTFSSEFPFIDFKTVVNWTQHNKLLKVAFPTTVRSRFARFGIQFGHIQRPTHKNTRRDMAKFEAAGRWVDLSESSSGLSLCSSVKAGFDVHEKVIRMSLLKAPLQTDKWADFGIRKFSYRLICHQGGFEASNVVQLSDELVVPVVVGNAKGTGQLPATSEFVVVRDENVVLETLKPAFNCDGFVCRFYESSGGWRRTIVTFPLLENTDWDVEVVDLMERGVDAPGLQKGSEKQFGFDLMLNAFELMTILVRRQH